MKSTKTFFSLGVILVALLLVPKLGWSQLPAGGIAGIVYDRTGAVVPGAEITLRDVQTGTTQKTSTSTTGGYEFVQLRPGTYDLTVEAKGFRRTVERGVVVNVGQAVRLDVTLEVGDIAQTVEVRAEVPLIEPDRTSISRAVDVRALKNLPMLNRQILNLALTVPGTVPGAPGTQVVAFTVAGMRSQSNNYTLDGISNNDPQVNGPLNLFQLSDAIQEFNVQTSIASTEVGRNSGAQVNIITKSGGNSYHGTLFYYHRNDAFDATPFFLNRAGQPKNPLRRHQFGGTVGGYILPNKTFWFFSFEGFRQTVSEPATARVPTDAERAVVTDSVSKKLLQFWPVANTPQLLATTGKNWTGTTPSKNDNETFFWRIDHNLSVNHRLMGRYAWFRGRTLARQTDPFNGAITNGPGQHSFLFQETYATGRVVNEFRAGFSRNRTFFLPADVNINPAEIFTGAAGPLPGYVDTTVDALDGGLPRITITGFSSGGLGAGTNMPQGRATNTYEYIDNLSLIGPWGLTRHTLRFGIHMRREITNRFLNGNYRGSISFAGWGTIDPATGNCINSETGKGDPTVSCFVLGRPQRGTLRTGVGGTFRTWFRAPVYLYAQDTFKARPNLTINYGLRWEYPGQMSEKRNRGSNFVPGAGMMALNSNLRIDVDPTKLGRAALVLTPLSDVLLPNTGQWHGDTNNFAPFLGIAYSPKIWPGFFGNGKTVIRTGFRLSYDDVFANIPVNMGLNFPPVLTTTLPTGVYAWGTVLSQNRSLFTSDKTVPEGTRGILTFNAWDVKPPNAYGMNYALEIERQIGRDFVVEASYVGSQGRKLGVFLDPNQPTVIVKDPTKRGDLAPNVRIFPFRQYAGIGQGAFVSNSNYNGMVATIRKRPSHGLSFTASYTLGKSLDDNSSFFGSDADSGAFANTKDRKLDHGRSGFDVRHRVSVSSVYELPSGGTRGLLGQVVGGWVIAGVTSYRSGFPFSVHTGHSTDRSGLNQFADRPNWAAGVTELPTNMDDPDKAFDPSVFVLPGAGDTGNVGRNRFTGPSLINFDFAVLKNFPFGEGRRVQFRAEFFNAFNHANFDLPEHNLDSSSKGKITSDAGPRLIQFGLRVEW